MSTINAIWNGEPSYKTNIMSEIDTKSLHYNKKQYDYDIEVLNKYCFVGELYNISFYNKLFAPIVGVFLGFESYKNFCSFSEASKYNVELERIFEYNASYKVIVDIIEANFLIGCEKKQMQFIMPCLHEAKDKNKVFNRWQNEQYQVQNSYSNNILYQPKNNDQSLLVDRNNTYYYDNYKPYNVITKSAALDKDVVRYNCIYQNFERLQK